MFGDPGVWQTATMVPQAMAPPALEEEEETLTRAAEKEKEEETREEAEEKESEVSDNYLSEELYSELSQEFCS